MPNLSSRGGLLRDDSRADQLVAVVPRGELSRGDSPLGRVENKVGPFVADEQPGPLQRLAVTDADAEAGALPGREGAGGIDPMYLAGGDVQRRAPQPGMGVALADVNDVLRGVGREDEQRLPAAADAESLALADGVEMRAVVFADFLAVANRVAPRGGERRELSVCRLGLRDGQSGRGGIPGCLCG